MRRVGVVGLRRLVAGIVVAEALGEAGSLESGVRMRVEDETETAEVDAAAAAVVVMVMCVVRCGTMGVVLVLLTLGLGEETGLLGALRAMGPGVLMKVVDVVAAAGAPAAGLEGGLLLL